MSSTPPGQPPSWKAGASGRNNKGGAPTPRRPWQQDANVGEGNRRRVPRWLKIGSVATAFGALVGIIILVILIIRPPSPPLLVLLEAPNATNIAVPHDVAGQHGLDGVRGALHDTFPNNSVIQQPFTNNSEVMGREVWGPLESEKREKIVLFIAAHGGVDERGPFLLPEGADPGDPDNPGNVVRLDDILEHLKKVRSDQKLLILDATQVPFFWPLGQLRNDFGSYLESKEFAQKVADVKGLIVLSSSGANQQSWVSDGRRMTVFAQAVVEGLKGATNQLPDSDGISRVTVKKLHDYAVFKVGQWVRANRDSAVQTPLLIDPRGLAAKMELNVIDTTRPPPAAEDLVAFAPSAELTALWQTADELRGYHPEVYAPDQWRRYLDTALRVEELERAGDGDGATALRGSLGALGQRLRDARKLPVEALSCSLALAAALGEKLPPHNLALLRQDLDPLCDRKDAKADDFVQLTKRGAGVRGQLLYQLAVTGLLLDRAARNPETDLKPTPGRLPPFDGPGPAEVQPLPFLAKYLAPDCPAALKSQALKVRRQGERAALGLGETDDDQPACSEQVYRWIAVALQGADAQRREGEDLLVSGRKTDWEDAGKLLGDAEKGYRQVQDNAGKVRHALMTRAVALTQLPYYSRWVVERLPVANEQDMGDLEALWEQVHKLDALLRRPETADAAELGQAAERAQTAAEVVDNGLKAIRRRFDDEKSRLLQRAASDQEDYHKIDALLRVPFVLASERETLLAKLGGVAHDLESPRQAKAPDNDESKAKAMEAALNRTARSARAALALLGRKWVTDDVSHIPPTGEEVRRANKSESDWQANIDKAGDGVRFHWLRRLTEARRLNKEVGYADVMEGKLGSLPALAEAADQARHLDGAAVARLGGDPIDDERHMQASELLNGLAWRAACDDWGGDVKDPYFRKVANAYLDDALKLALLDASRQKLDKKQQEARKARIEDLRTKIKAIKEPGLEWADRDAAPPVFRDTPPVLELTLDDRLVFDYRVAVPPEVGPVAPVVFVRRAGQWLKTGEGDLVARALPRQAADKAPPAAELTLSLDDKDKSPPAQARSDYDVTGLFRGRDLRLHTDVGANFVADATSWRPEPDECRVAVQASPELHALYGDGTGRIAIVLDCSDSMGDPKNRQPDGKTRFEAALTALETVLKEIPSGTKVSLWAFAQKTPGVNGPKDVEKTIKRILAPEKWDPSQVADLMKRVRQLEPDNWTPLLRAMLEAKADLEGGDKEDGNRTLLVLTDGSDNRFEKWEDQNFRNPGDPVYNRDGKKFVEDVLVNEFGKSGIAVKMVGFQLDAAEKAAAQRQFIDPIRKKLINPRGEFYEADNVEKLIAGLRLSLRQRLVYQVKDGDKVIDGEAPDGKRFTERTVSRIGDNPHWVTLAKLGGRDPLASYTVYVNSNQPLAQTIRVRPGESLLLKLVKKDNRLLLERVLYARENLPAGSLPPPRRVGNNWVMGTWENRRRTTDFALQLRTTLEDESHRTAEAGKALDQRRPGLVWFRVSQGEDTAAKPGLRFYPLYGETAPAWQLSVPDWKEKMAPTIQAWWDDPDPDHLAPGRFALDKAEANTLPETGQWHPLTAQDRLDNADARAVAARARWKWQENRLVSVAPGGQKTRRNCLVVSLDYPKDNPFVVRLPDSLAGIGEEHMIFERANRYVGLFWSPPGPLENQLKALRSLTVVSLKDFMKHAEREGLSTKVDLPLPQ